MEKNTLSKIKKINEISEISKEKATLYKKGNEYFSLLEGDETMELVSTEDNEGNKAYERTLCFILTKAVKDVLPRYTLRIEYSMSKGLFCELKGRHEVTEEELKDITNRMDEIIKENYDITMELKTRDKAVEIFKNQEESDKSELIEHNGGESIKLWKLLDLYGYFYGNLAPSTGRITHFSLEKYKSGFIMLYPCLDKPYELPLFKPSDKLFEIFDETGDWDSIIGVHDLATLNEKVRNGETKYLISIAEGLHEKKYVNIANEISRRERVKIVLISGPSSSGKTTSSKRLSIQLMVNGLKPYTIEMDNYFVNREDTPLLPDGTYDFESLRALDLELFSKHMESLIAGETVRMPKFNFKTGLREEGKELKIPSNGILVIEGIHALNPELLKNIQDRQKFKIYVSALTQLNMDNGNRISTTDVRRLRRMVRDYSRRGYTAEETLTMFSGVIRGEKEYVYPYQEEADIMFNSTIVYEIPVLKKHALPLLKTIGKESRVFEESRRLMNMLSFVEDMGDEFVPPDSVLREFIGGSFFD